MAYQPQGFPSSKQASCEARAPAAPAEGLIVAPFLKGRRVKPSTLSKGIAYPPLGQLPWSERMKKDVPDPAASLLARRQLVQQRLRCLYCIPCIPLHPSAQPEEEAEGWTAACRPLPQACTSLSQVRFYQEPDLHL